jgi:predicted AAA+ superfamily ATPase
MNQKSTPVPAPRVFLTSFKFSDSTTIDLNPEDIVIVVGPNNVGKSVALEDIQDLVVSAKNKTKVITQLALDTSGSADELTGWLEKACRRRAQKARPDDPVYSRLGVSV